MRWPESEWRPDELSAWRPHNFAISKDPDLSKPHHVARVMALLDGKTFRNSVGAEYRRVK